MNCRAVVEIKTWANRITMTSEQVFEKRYSFEANSEQSAKSTITRSVKPVPEIQDIAGAVKGAMSDEEGLPDWWTPRPARWEAWEKTKRETYDENPDFNYCECYRQSQREFVSLDPKQPSRDVVAFIRLAWLECKEEVI